ncbi:Uncharacterized protein ACO02O_03126 [Dirofilaria immitis]
MNIAYSRQLRRRIAAHSICGESITNFHAAEKLRPKILNPLFYIALLLNVSIAALELQWCEWHVPQHSGMPQ